MDSETIHRSLVDWLTKVLNEVGTLDESQWDVLVFEHGCQIGTVTSWCRKRGATHRDQPELAVCLQLKAWSVAYDALPCPDEDEEQFDRAYAKMLRNQITSVKRAINDPSVKSHFTTLKKRSTFTIYSADEDEAGTEDCWQFLWGNRPAKRAFATSRELFTHIAQKAHLAPERNVRGRGDNVTGVTWFGHEFSDKNVAFLESVPNVTALCASLKRFQIEHTRVTQSGLDRLRALFPNTNFRVVPKM